MVQICLGGNEKLMYGGWTFHTVPIAMPDRALAPSAFPSRWTAFRAVEYPSDAYFLAIRMPRCSVMLLVGSCRWVAVKMTAEKREDVLYSWLLQVEKGAKPITARPLLSS